MKKKLRIARRRENCPETMQGAEVEFPNIEDCESCEYFGGIKFEDRTMICNANE